VKRKPDADPEGNALYELPAQIVKTCGAENGVPR
jgi:hypothetical protein